MKYEKIGIFYGSTTGTTESVAEQIASHLGVGSSEVYNVGNTDAKVAEEYELLILGSSTWGSGELQDDWYDFLEHCSFLIINRNMDVRHETYSVVGMPCRSDLLSVMPSGSSMKNYRVQELRLSELSILRIIPMMPPLPKSTDSWSDY